jgi:aryl-alcohol dehydrogenase-like predicted oxidoreductase
MELRTLGKTGLQVSNICLGAMNFGQKEWGATEKESVAMVDAFVEGGGNFIDTANVYSEGASEEIVGKAIQGRRDRLIIATKGFFPVSKAFGEPPVHENALGASRRHLTEALEASLRRLGTDYVDLYQVHCWDAITSPHETLSALDKFVHQGKVRYVGLSNFTAWQIVECRYLSMEEGWEPYVTAQHQYSLIRRDVEHGVIPACQRYGIGLLPWSPLGQGILAGKYGRDGKPAGGTRFSGEPKNEMQRRWRKKYINDRSLEIADAVKGMAKEMETTPVALSIAWVLGRPTVSSVIIGPRSKEQLQGNLAAGEVSFSEEQLRKLDEASAPELPYPESMQAIIPRSASWLQEATRP